MFLIKTSTVSFAEIGYRSIGLGAAICTLNAATLHVPESYSTVQEAVNAAQPGDVVLVSSGVYDESIATARNGSAENPIVIDGHGVSTLKQVNLRHAHIHLQNLRVSGITNHFSQLIYVDRGASFCVISNNVVDVEYATNVYAIRWAPPATRPFGTAASNVLMISNTVQHVNGYVAVTVYGDSNLITGNFIRDCPQSDVFNVWGRWNTFSYNTCSNFPYSDTLKNHSDFIQTFGNHGYGSMDIVVDSNFVIGVPDGGVTMIALNQLSACLLPTISNWTFRNNVFVNLGLHGSCSIPNVKYYNNTFVRCNFYNGGHAVTFSSRYFNVVSVYDGSSGTDYAHGGECINNVFYDCGDSRDTTGWYYFGQDLTNVAADYNFVAKPDSVGVRMNTLQQSVGDPGGWNLYAWWEPHGINGGDPLFLSRSELDFRLTDESPLIGAALPLNQLFATDFRGVIRGTQWDIGAIEFEAGRTVLPAPPLNLHQLHR